MAAFEELGLMPELGEAVAEMNWEYVNSCHLNNNCNPTYSLSKEIYELF